MSLLIALGASILLVGGAATVDLSPLAELPWRGLAHPEGSSVSVRQSNVAVPGTDDERTSRDTRPTASPSPTAPILSLTGDFPSSGPNSFVFASDPGPVLGTAGTLRRFRLGIEKGVDEDLAAFATMVDQSLGSPQGWTASGQLRLQRVAATDRYDFTIYLATGQTAGWMCAQGGLDIMVDGQPYTSCRLSEKVILNLSRWRLSVPAFVSGQVPLETYRTYMINHEVGHELGHRHELCPGKGRPAPVMQQQTLGLQGCTANPWPYLDGKRYSGAPTW